MIVAAAGLLTGWGEGVQALPTDARRAAAGRSVIDIPRPSLGGDRFRRATRECLLGVAAVEVMLAESGLGRETLRGSGTGLVYVTAAAYAASNRAFIEQAGGTSPLHFPYTAPSAVPGEVAIEFGLAGPYVIMLGDARTTTEALWQSATMLQHGACQRVLVLAVETFVECADLFREARWLVRGPLVETAVAVLGTPGDDRRHPDIMGIDACLLEIVERRAGETLACAPLIALALARAGRAGARPAG
ncbi:MAG: beta-ketoacyl synthase N-terminal-like domain-containing protein [Candidatus Rokuibacteriota bacterium]